MGGGGSSDSNHSQDTTNWSTAWAPGTNAAQGGLDNAESQLGSYFSPAQYDLANDATSTAENSANLNGSNAAYASLLNPNSTVNSQLEQTALGANTNPQLNSMFQQGAGQVQQALAGEFNSSGRLGSGQQEFNTSTGLNNLATDIYGGAYAQDQSNALAANQELSGNTATGASGLTSNYNSQLGGLSTASGLQASVSPYAQLQDYDSLVSPFLNLNTTNQNNSSYGVDNDGSAANDVGYAGLLAGTFAKAFAGGA